MYKILMVEDDMVIARKTTQFLGSWGYDAKCVEVFDRVLETVNEWNPDLVIMDVSLPYRNGFEWTRQIRLHSKVPILFNLKYGFDECREFCIFIYDIIFYRSIPICNSNIQCICSVIIFYIAKRSISAYIPCHS